MQARATGPRLAPEYVEEALRAARLVNEDGSPHGDDLRRVTAAATRGAFARSRESPTLWSRVHFKCRGYHEAVARGWLTRRLGRIASRPCVGAPPTLLRSADIPCERHRFIPFASRLASTTEAGGAEQRRDVVGVRRGSASWARCVVTLFWATEVRRFVPTRAVRR